MQMVALAIAFATVAVLTVLLARRIHHPDRQSVLQVGVGVLIGGCAAAIILVTQSDLVPDADEPFLIPLAILAITVVLAAGTILRSARH